MRVLRRDVGGKRVSDWLNHQFEKSHFGSPFTIISTGEISSFEDLRLTPP